jgi:hypothetical protein
VKRIVLALVGLLGASVAAAAPAIPQPKPGQQVLYGHVRSIARAHGRWEMRFDPALWLGGVAAERAAVEDGAIAPGEPVPNDHYVVDESRRLLTFVVAANARARVITTPNIRLTTVPVGELAQIVAGRNPRHRRLMEPEAGFWIVVSPKYPNAVVALEQQYQP